MGDIETKTEYHTYFHNGAIWAGPSIVTEKGRALLIYQDFIDRYGKAKLYMKEIVIETTLLKEC